MNRKEWALVAVGVIVIIVIVAVVRTRHSSTQPGSGSFTNGTNGTGSQTRAEVPAGVVAPGQDAQNLPANVAAPKIVVSAAPSVPYSFRKFDIKVENGQFVPSEVIVNEKDTVNLQITAVDTNYDFYQPDYGLASALPKGQTKTIEFGGVSTGKFTFYCQACGGPAKGPVGYVTVVPLSQ